MAGKRKRKASGAAPLSRPANAWRRAKKAAEPAEKPGKHKRSTRATQEEHKRNTRGQHAIPWLATGLCLACNWPVPRLSVPLGGFARLFRILHSAFCIRPSVAIPWLAPRIHRAILPVMLRDNVIANIPFIGIFMCNKKESQAHEEIPVGKQTDTGMRGRVSRATGE